MTEREKQARFIFMDAQLVLFAVKNNTPLVCLEWWRTIERQRVLVSRGASKTMNSMHLKGLAKDYCFLADLQDDGKLNYDVSKYKALGEFWESLSPDNVWGGRFGESETGKGDGWDAGHFEYAV